MITRKTMKMGRYLMGIVGVLLLLWGCAAQELEQADTVLSETSDGSQVAIVSNIAAESLVGKVRITVNADSDLTYTAFKLTDPLRLVLDLPNVDTSQVQELTFSAQPPLIRVTPFQFTEGGTTNSRIEVALSHLVPYQVFSDANKLFIDLEMPVDTQIAGVQPLSPLPPGFEELTPSPQISPTVIEAKPGDTSTLQIMSQPEAPSSELSGAPTLEIVPPPETVGEVSTVSQVLATPSELSVITNIDVSEVDGKTRIILYADQTPEFDVKRTDLPPRLTIDLRHSDLSPGAEKVIMPEGLETLVKQVRLFQLRRTPGGEDNVARMLVELMQPAQHQVSTEPGKFILDIAHPALDLAETPEGQEIVEVPLTTGIEEALLPTGEEEEEETATSPTIRAPKTGEEKEYKGQLISIHFQSADIIDVLDVIAEVSGLNLVVHPGVSGEVTVRLDNIPWDQALDIVLKMNNLAVEIDGNILRIAQASVFQNEVAQRVQQQRQEIEARRVQAELEPLETKLLTVNFVEPGTMVGLINQYFMGIIAQQAGQQRRGTITPDPRTKTLIIQDTAANIKTIESIVHTLDRRTPQVMIEARIVSLSTTVRKELGITWSGRFSADPLHGNPLGYRFPYTLDSSFGVNLPQVGSPVMSVPLQLGSIDDVISVFARIDAAEEDYKAKTLSQPKIFTQDSVGATVNSTRTVYVPVRGDSQTAASVEPISAALSLNVTPLVSRDGFITMNVNVSNGSVATTTGGEAQTITQSVNSRVTVRDGETVVIGGIYGTEEVDNFTAVPFLHKIPILGWLFKSTLPNSKTQDELLVFLTPRILDRSVLKAEDDLTGISASY